MLTNTTTGTTLRTDKFGATIRPDGPCGSVNRIYRCKVCKGAKTLVLTRVREYLGTYATRHGSIPSQQFRRWLEFHGRVNFEAPTCCSRTMKSVDVVGIKSEHVCGAKCLASKGPTCECSCGGANHGKAYV
jgi:hypothetical protein